MLAAFSSPTGTDDRRQQHKSGASKHFEILSADTTNNMLCPYLGESRIKPKWVQW